MGVNFLIDPVTRLLDPLPDGWEEAQALLAKRERIWKECAARFLQDLVARVLKKMRVATANLSPVKKAAPPPPPPVTVVVVRPRVVGMGRFHRR